MQRTGLSDVEAATEGEAISVTRQPNIDAPGHPKRFCVRRDVSSARRHSDFFATVSSGDFQPFSKNNGIASRTAPQVYVTVGPSNQYTAEAHTGPVARANAPNERKIPITLPFSDSRPEMIGHCYRRFSGPWRAASFESTQQSRGDVRVVVFLDWKWHEAADKSAATTFFRSYRQQRIKRDRKCHRKVQTNFYWHKISGFAELRIQACNGLLPLNPTNKKFTAKKIWTLMDLTEIKIYEQRSVSRTNQIWNNANSNESFKLLGTSHCCQFLYCYENGEYVN